MCLLKYKAPMRLALICDWVLVKSSPIWWWGKAWKFWCHIDKFKREGLGKGGGGGEGLSTSPSPSDVNSLLSPQSFLLNLSSQWNLPWKDLLCQPLLDVFSLSCIFFSYSFVLFLWLPKCLSVQQCIVIKSFTKN